MTLTLDDSLGCGVVGHWVSETHLVFANWKAFILLSFILLFWTHTFGLPGTVPDFHSKSHRFNPKHQEWVGSFVSKNALHLRFCKRSYQLLLNTELVQVMTTVNMVRMTERCCACEYVEMALNPIKTIKLSGFSHFSALIIFERPKITSVGFVSMWLICTSMKHEQNVM